MILLNIYRTEIRWTDQDAYGHLNNAVFLDYMTEARAELFKDVLAIEGICQFVTVHAECDYKIPYYYPDSLILKQYCEKIGNSSFELKYEFFSKNKKDALHASGKVTMVAFDPIQKKAIKLPDVVISLLKRASEIL
jgi:acyl-CoA thioester hydrolase